MAGKAPSGYGGQGFSLRGEKGRFVLPPAFRNAIAPGKDDARILCLAKHDRWNCLSGFGIDRKDSIEDLLDREEDNAVRRGEPFDRELRSMQLWNFVEVPFDASGRFVLPDHLAELCTIDSAICFLGGGRAFTLWAPAKLYEMGQGWEGQQALCRKFEADANVKGRRK